MELYKHKDLDMGFVILCLEPNVKSLKVTVNSIRRRYDSSCVAAVWGGADDSCLAEMNAICPTYRGKETVTSLVNVGMDRGRHRWSMTVLSGIGVHHNLIRKYSQFVESERDVMYAIVNGVWGFGDCSLNGIMVHRDTWRDLGHMIEDMPLAICKLEWAMRAIEAGSKVKGVIGVRVV